MLFKSGLMRVFRFLKQRRREIRPSEEEMSSARMIMSKVSTSNELDIVDRAAKLKSIIEGYIHGDRES
jgi:hypothetical protein